MLAIQTVLFPTDFSEHARHAWSYALTFAHAFNAELVVLHVVAPPPRPIDAFGAQVDPTALLDSLRAEADAALTRLAQDARNRGLRCRAETRVGVDYEEIVEAASLQRADLIVMATHGRTGLAHALLGSVAERVVRRAPCPVLTVRHPALAVASV